MAISFLLTTQNLPRKKIRNKLYNSSVAPLSDVNDRVQSPDSSLPPPPHPYEAKHELMMRLGLLQGDRPPPSPHINSPLTRRKVNQDFKEDYFASVSSLASSTSNASHSTGVGEKLPTPNNTSPISTLTGN